MKKIFHLILLLLAVLLTSCVDYDDEVQQYIDYPNHRTVLVYIIPANLGGYAQKDIQEMKQGIKQLDTSINNLIVYYDKGKAGAELYKITSTGGGDCQQIIKEYPDQHSTTPEVMSQVIKDAFREYPAGSKGLILWSHGDGWIKANKKYKAGTRWWGSEERHNMDITDIATAIKAADVHFDFIMYDSCFMQNIETDYALRHHADYFIGSPTEIPGPGAPYQEITQYMFQRYDKYVENIAKSYYAFYKNMYHESGEWTDGVSISVVKSSELDNLAAATAAAMPSEVNIEIYENIFNYDCRSSKYYSDFKMAMKEIAPQQYDIWYKAFQKAVPVWNTTPTNFSAFGGNFAIPEETGGLSCYLPRAGQEKETTFWHSYEWYKAAGWNKKDMIETNKK